MFNDYFFEKYLNDEDVVLFNPNEVPDLNSYLGDYDEFKRRYEEAIRTVPIEKQTIIAAKTILHYVQSSYQAVKFMRSK